ncbi:50S ribosomal protein L11 methyltransferase [Fimbriimonas ginsengisoli]|uniref:50S ribosomal protein L11 methyltransferase n=1 Tax=Fimbriimonas ginsengisoli TaxID=1005039 RepID=UPI001D0ED18C|nr:50S ribosomal protein L11 methyltransferase [Fimbriimonas ginsengisoli]
MRAQLPVCDDISHLIEIFRDFGIENTQEEGSDLVGCLVEVEGSTERAQALSQALLAAGAIDVKQSPFEEQNWDEVWRQFFKPRRVGNHFVVRPTWEEFESQPDDLTIVLDPGEAFGTGDHPTTRMCLELLEQAPVNGSRVADIGCGSGILSIGAVLLGAAQVDAVDVDPASVAISKENAELNGVSFRVIVGEGVRSLFEAETDAATRVAAQKEWDQDEHPLDASFTKPETVQVKPGPESLYDLVISNIISRVLIRLAPEVATALRPGGEWIVSGIIHDNWPDVQAEAEANGFTLEEKREEGEWVAARFHKS